MDGQDKINLNNEDIDKLRILYSEVIEILPGIYATKSEENYGLVDKIHNITVPNDFSQATYRRTYSIFRGNVNDNLGKIVFYNSGREVKLNTTKYSPIAKSDTDIDEIVEHSGCNFSVIELNTTNNNGKRETRLYNGITGERLIYLEDNLDYNISYRPYDLIILSIEQKSSKKIWGITKDLEFGPIEDVLSTVYKKITSKKDGKEYIAFDHNDKEYVLNRYGQLY